MKLILALILCITVASSMTNENYMNCKKKYCESQMSKDTFSCLAYNSFKTKECA